jgi:hypothetical protein
MRIYVVTLLAGVTLAGCGGDRPVLEINLRSPHDPTLLDGVEGFVFSVKDVQGRPLVLRQFGAPAGRFELDQIPYGTGRTFRLEGLLRGSPVLVGQSCPTDVISGKPLPAVSMLVSGAGSFSAVEDPPGPPRLRPLVFARQDGRIVVAGGAALDGTAALATALGFDARTGRWMSENGLVAPRRRGELAAFGASGEFLVVGGEDAGGLPVDTAELYDPTQGFRVVSGASGFGGAGVRASTLSDGSVLVTGGTGGDRRARADMAVFDGRELRIIGMMRLARRAHTVSAVGTGNFSAAFVIGGDGGQDGLAGVPVADIELVNPRAAGADGVSSVVGKLARARAEHTATLLSTGELLIVGGRDAQGPLTSTEIFDPITRAVAEVGALGRARTRHAASLLRDGRVLVTGGTGLDGSPLRSAELYDPVARSFAAAKSLVTPRADHAAIELCDGTVLLVGGGPGAEIYNPAP